MAEPLATLSPTCVRVAGYIYDELDEARARQSFALLASRLQGALMEEGSHGLLVRAAAEAPYESYLKLLLGHDYCLYQAWVTPIADDLRAPFDAAIRIAAHLPPLLPTQPLFQTRILTGQEPLGEASVLALYDGGVPARSLIHARRLQVNREEGLYLLFPTAESVPNRLISAVVDDISRLELYYHKILAFYANYPDLYRRVNQVEERASRRMEEATELPIYEWLNDVSDRYVDLSNVTRALQQDMYSLQANLNNLEETLQRWGERELGDYPPLSELLLGQARLVVRAHEDLAGRVDSIRTRLSDVVTMVRTRSEVNRLKMTGFIQFVTTALGMSGVANQIFETLRDRGIIPASIPTSTMTLLFVPFAILVAWLVNRWLSRRC